MKNLISKFLDSKNAVFGVFLIVALSMIYNTLVVIDKNYTLQQQVDKLADEIALIEVQNQNLKYNIEYYKTDSYLKNQAKRRFNLAEPGEKVIFFDKNNNQTTEQNSSAVENKLETKPQYRDNFDKWFIFLFGKSN